MKVPTKRQKKVLDWIRKYHRTHGIAPSRTEIAHGLGLSEAASVSSHIKALVRHGLIEVTPKKVRAIRVIEDDLPVIGPLAEVAAGTPIVCSEHIVEHVPAAVAARFRPRPDYLLTVRGDSMDKTGIRDGDAVAVHRTRNAETGQVVVARFGDEVTMKRFTRVDRRRVELRPESHNPDHKVMKLDLAKHILEIDGVVVGALVGPPQEPATA